MAHEISGVVAFEKPAGCGPTRAIRIEGRAENGRMSVGLMEVDYDETRRTFSCMLFQSWTWNAPPERVRRATKAAWHYYLARHTPAMCEALRARLTAWGGEAATDPHLTGRVRMLADYIGRAS